MVIITTTTFLSTNMRYVYKILINFPRKHAEDASVINNATKPSFHNGLPKVPQLCSQCSLNE